MYFDCQKIGCGNRKKPFNVIKLTVRSISILEEKCQKLKKEMRTYAQQRKGIERFFKLRKSRDDNNDDNDKI